MRIQQLFTGVVGVVGVCLFGSLPAKASPRLQTWQFDTGQNRFMFTTEGGVQPQVTVLHHPKRLIIDLPGIVIDESVGDQFIGGAVRSVKVMQADARTTRMVLEIDPAYSFDPQQVKVWGLTDSQWVVQLPSSSLAPPESPHPPTHPPTATASAPPIPSRPTVDSLSPTTPLNPTPDAIPSPSTIPSPTSTPSFTLATDRAKANSASVPVSPRPTSSHPTSPHPTSGVSSPNPSPLPPLLSRNQVSYAPVSPTATVIQGVQATTSGFFLPIAGATPQVQIYRTRDANQMRQIVIDVLNAAIPPQLTPDALPPARYGISRWTVTQFPTLPPAVRITLNLDNVSPDWQVNWVAGGLVMTPIGMAANQIATPPTTVVLPVINAAPAMQQTPQAIYPGATTAQPTTAQIPNRGQVVVMLDPGHGGADPGAIGIGGLQEKGVVIAVAQQAAATLRSQGINVQMTRQSDETIDLQPRVDRAAAANATVFVSIHANAVNMQRPEVNGLETYYFSDSGLTLATAIHRRVLGTVPMNDRGVKQARFFVLRRTSMPSALIEIGFVTGATDAPKLRDPQWQAQMGQAIAAGILDYLQQGGR